MSQTGAIKGPQDILHWLLSPWVILGSLIAGTFMGIFLPETARTCAFLGDLYLRLLQMCVLPIMITAIVSSVARLFSSGMSGRMLVRVVGVFCAGLLLASVIGLTVGLLGKPGDNLDQNAKEVVGRLITSFSQQDGQEFVPDMELSLAGDPHEPEKSVGGFLNELVPANIFQAMQNGNTLQLLFFSLLFGVALSFISEDLRERLLVNIEGLFEAFILIIGWLMYLLPLGLFFLIANQLACVGLEVLGAMTKYIAWVYGGAILLMIINGVVISLRTQKGFVQSFRLLKQPLLLSFFTRNSYAAMPSAIEVMHEGFNVDKDTTHFVIPLGITLARFGTVMVFSLSAVFLAQLFDVELTFFNCVYIVLLSVVAGVASAGSPGVVALTMIALILDPLGLPLEVAMVLLLAVDSMTDPVLTLVNVHTNCAASTLVQGDAT